jgi:tetratricopeptide (TPR) repeat protein
MAQRRPSTSQLAGTVRELTALPPQQDPGFATGARRVLTGLADSEQVLRAVLADVSNTGAVRFAALYTLLVKLNREDRVRDYADLVRTHEAEFGAEPYFNTFRALVARGYGLGRDAEALRRAVDFARRADADLPNSQGIKHQIAWFIADYLEAAPATATSATLLEEADRAVSAAIAAPGGQHGHYYETLARLHLLRRDYPAARSAITEAIQLEPSDSPDFYRRLARYQATRVRIDLVEERDRMTERQESFRGELERFRTQQLELLGLLAAVVAFVVSASSIAAQTPKTGDGARLICTMAGAVILVFASFTFANSRASAKRLAPVVVLGSALLLTGLLM